MFDLIEYNKSHETDTPIRNKWFKFFKLDESKLPEYEPEILPHGNEDKSLNIKELRKKHGFFKGQKEWKKKQKEIEDKNDKIYKDWAENHYEESLVQVTNPVRIYFSLLANMKSPKWDEGLSIGKVILVGLFFLVKIQPPIEYLVSPDIYLGKNGFVQKVEKGFWWVVSKILFGWLSVILWTFAFLAIFFNIMTAIDPFGNVK
jgi:hypothetical protein